ncbi:hypothetical protein PPERSA_09480 [Pseudocohnilembus persalinus]|uniref:DAAF9 N-terminal domain-containing protein n=1 Tax=Pseudocohnilembus persalinus TaxID=266149 RepID=A0A0V0QRN0_PSEPJ|nr:hypothetical protein PPERSA_09480 [Pseudocohnilembus persalinus]|eukprot:KRX04688.1 hypothetical protein PPERSA_09480 [Pseudocohnilembus persalinus]
MLSFFHDKQREGKTAEYKVNDFIYRFRKIEKCLEKENLDSLLLVTGIDGLENNNTISIFNWLFLGYSGVEILENDFLSSSYANTIILIQKHQVNLYISYEGLQSLKHLIYAIPNIKVFATSQEQELNENECENIKLNYFLQVMDGVQRVGVVLGKKDEGKIKRIEKWPLIQGYGLSEFGKGFFSMCHQPVDITGRLIHSMKTHDKYSLSQIIYGNAQRLSGHFIAAAGVLGDTKFHKRQLITENQLTEIIRDAYELEQLSRYVNEDQTLPKPRVLFGHRTDLDFQSQPEDLMLKQCGLSDETPCLHATFESLDLHSQARCARTYFLTNNVKQQIDIENILDDYNAVQDYEIKEVENKSFLDEQLLINLYVNLVISFQESLQQIAKDITQFNLEFIRRVTFQRLSKVAQQSNFNLEQNQIEIDLKVYDAYGKQVKLDFNETKAFKLTPYQLMMRIQIKNIQSLQFPQKCLGSVLLADSFIIQEGCYFIITRQVPYLLSYNTDNTYSQKIQDLKKRIETKELGPQINEWDPSINGYKMYQHCRIFIPTGTLTHFGVDIPIIDSQIILHEKGLRIKSDQTGWFTLFFKDLKNVYFTSGLMTNWLVCQLESNIILQSLGKQNLCIEFPKEAVEKILYKLQDYLKENDIEYGFIEGSSPQIFLESNIASKFILGKQDTRLIKQNQIQNEVTFLEYLESKQLMIQNAQKDLKLISYKNIQELQNNQVQDVNKIQIILVNGAENSGKQKFCDNLSILGKPDYQTFVLNLKYQQFQNLDAKTYVNQIIVLCKQSKAIQGNILICPVPHFISTQKIIDYFTKNEKLSNIFHIRNVFTKINVNNFYENENKGLVNSTLQYGIQGFSQGYVIDSYDNYEKEIDDIENIIKSVMPEQKVYRVQGNIIHMGQGKDMLDCNYYWNEYNVFNRLRFSVFLEKMETFENYQFIFIPFTLPIIEKHLYIYLRNELFKQKKGFLWSDQELQQIMEPIKEHYQDSKDELTVQIVSILEKNEVSKLEKKTSKINFIKGVGRISDKLKDGLFEFTINQNYLAQRKLKQVKTEVQKTKIELSNGQFQEIEVATYKGMENTKFDNQLGFYVGGYNLNAEKIQDYLLNLWIERPKLKKTISKKDFTHDEKKQIERQNLNYPLESGYCFDGSLFRDEDGQALPFHPKIEEILDQHVNKINQTINQENDVIMSDYLKIKETQQQVFYQ